MAAPATAGKATKEALSSQPTTVPPPHLRNTYLSSDFPTVTTTPEAIAETLLCGPLLRYCGTIYSRLRNPLWRGTVLVVLKNTNGPVPWLAVENRQVQGESIHNERERTFWRFAIEVELAEEERRIEYAVMVDSSALERSFWIPAAAETMRVMVHSCNGFSAGSDENAFSGPALWNDVLRLHFENPIHVMLGGGDQNYNDSVRVTGPLKEWANMKNPVKRRRQQWTEQLDRDTDEWYCRNYLDWYSTAPFSYANSQIPQINCWDDHDIIDGYGSYTDAFMMSPVFKGIGRIARKYYLLIQHHTNPTSNLDDEPSWVPGKTPGRYMGAVSSSVYARLGRSVGYLAVDARTERTRHQINLPETYDVLFNRVEHELERAGGETSHLLVMLGVPIAYPRLVWLENLLTSPVIGVIRFLNKRFGVADGLFNNFDGEVDILDDLDDHYCARPHKRERNELLLRFQKLADKHRVRITFLSGDVHLAAVGRFYSNPKLDIPVSQDHRYMVNVITSAITNKPPPEAVSNLLARRNKVHHLDAATDEQLLDFFDKDVHGNPRGKNKNTMPSRNFCIITESKGDDVDGLNAAEEEIKNGPKRKGTNAVGEGELGAGAQHPAAAAGEKDGIFTKKGALNVAIRVEVDKSQESGETKAFGFAIPMLNKAESNGAGTNAAQPITE